MIFLENLCFFITAYIIGIFTSKIIINKMDKYDVELFKNLSIEKDTQNIKLQNKINQLEKVIEIYESKAG